MARPVRQAAALPQPPLLRRQASVVPLPVVRPRFAELQDCIPCAKDPSTLYHGIHVDARALRHSGLGADAASRVSTAFGIS